MAATDNSYQKSDTTDVQEPLRTANSWASADTSVPLRPNGSSTFTYRVPVNGRRHAEIRLWSNASGGTIAFKVKLYPHDDPRQDRRADTYTAKNPFSGKGFTVYDATWTTSGSTTPDMNPITGEVSANIWYEASADTTTNYNCGADTMVMMFPAAGTAATNYEKRLMIDTHACQWLVVEGGALGTATAALASVRFTD